MNMQKVVGLCVGVVTTLSLGYYFSKSTGKKELTKAHRIFVPYEEIAKNGDRHILLGRNKTEFSSSSQLILSPHFNSSTPKSLRANTITESAFKYLEKEREFFDKREIILDFEANDFQVEKITSEEFDFDALIAILVLTDSPYCLRKKKLLIEVANFAKYENIMSSSGQDVARIVFALRELYQLYFPKSSSALSSSHLIYQKLLEEVKEVLEDVVSNLSKKYYKLFERQDLLYQNSILLLKKEMIKVEAFPCLDLNIFYFYRSTPSLSSSTSSLASSSTSISSSSSLSHILSRSNKNFLIAPIHSSTLPLFTSLFIYDEGDYEFQFRAESSVDYFCDVNSRKPLPRPTVSPLLLSLNQLESKLGGKGVWMYEENSQNFVHSSRIFLSTPSSSDNTNQKVLSVLNKDEFKTECINFLKLQIYPHSPPSKILNSFELKSSLKRENKTDKVQKKVVV